MAILPFEINISLRASRLAVILSLVFAASQSLLCDAAERPNVLLVLADDLGFSDLGCYGGEIETPVLDGLAANGLRYNQFYNTARCWPTRAVLMTGYYAQQVRRDALPKLGGGGGMRNARPKWAPLLPALLKPAGYRSYHSGKWHLDGMPIAGGFDRSYYLKDQGRFFNPAIHWEDDQKLPAVANDTGYYGTTAIAEHAIKCLKEHQSQHSDAPFFHYLAFTAPHFPLHALPEDIAKYQGRYSAGWEAIRTTRYQRQQAIGLFAAGSPQIALSEVELNLGPPYHFPSQLKMLGNGEVNRPSPWNQLSTEQQNFQISKMAIHAAMIDRLDQELGRVINQIKAMQQYENTLILFLSDNGASAEIMVRADGHDPEASPGSAESYLCLGPGWSTTSNTPFRRHKTWVHEGGISTPLIAHWPNGIKAKAGNRTAAGHVIDIVPTILDVANIQPPKRWQGRPVPTKPGLSLLPTFAADSAIDRDYLWWFHDGHKAVRTADLKLVAEKNGPWELYNVKTDRSEQRNLADQLPEDVLKLKRLWNKVTLQFINQLQQN
ncbi:MAG: arylsulfatase [Fuerstiella sp.]